jgi:ElaB/YqjD/DUF883 family membrane-anchored ribosome-binding protein
MNKQELEKMIEDIKSIYTSLAADTSDRAEAVKAHLHSSLTFLILIKDELAKKEEQTAHELEAAIDAGLKEGVV